MKSETFKVYIMMKLITVFRIIMVVKKIKLKFYENCYILMQLKITFSFIAR